MRQKAAKQPEGIGSWGEVRARDRELVAACLEGDERAWEDMWQRYGPLVKAVARRSGCDDEEVREVLQRVALVALQGLERLRDPAKLAGWLAGVARFQSREMFRQRRPGEALHERSAIADAATEDELARDQELVILRQALDRLEPRCRRLVHRLDLKEPSDSYSAVAADEGLSPTSIGPIRRRCLNRLRKIFEKLSRSRE